MGSGRASPRASSIGPVTRPGGQSGPTQDPAFPNTTWGVLRRTAPGEPGYRAQLETLCRRYWAPIRQYARAAGASDENDADDFTQEFFVWLFDRSVLERYALERGSFRNFLKGLLRNFGRNYRRARRSRTRREGTPLEPEAPVTDERLDAAERAFDRAFLDEVLARAVERLRARSATGPRALEWRVFEGYDLAPADARPTVAELAAKHGITEARVKNYLHAVRTLLREEVRVVLMETVATRDELEEEWRRATE